MEFSVRNPSFKRQNKKWMCITDYENRNPWRETCIPRMFWNQRAVMQNNRFSRIQYFFLTGSNNFFIPLSAFQFLRQASPALDWIFFRFGFKACERCLTGKLECRQKNIWTLKKIHNIGHFNWDSILSNKQSRCTMEPKTRSNCWRSFHLLISMESMQNLAEICKYYKKQFFQTNVQVRQR